MFVAYDASNVKLDCTVPPHVACYVALMHALRHWNGEAVQEAFQSLREMYLKGLVSPLEIGYMLHSVISSIAWNGRVTSLIDEEEEQPVPHPIDINKRIAKEVFGGIPVDKERAAMFFVARAPLDWLHDGNVRVYWNSPLPDVSDFLVNVIKTAGMTTELLHQLLSRMPGFETKKITPLEHQIIGPTSKLGAWLADNIHSLDHAREQNPNEFVDAIYDYFEPAINSIIYTGKLTFYLTSFIGTRTMGRFVSKLLYELVPLLGSDKISDDRKGKIVELCFLFPPLKRGDFITEMSLAKRIIATGWAAHADTAKLEMGCQRLGWNVLEDFCGYSFADRGKHGTYSSALRDSGRILAILTMISPTGVFYAIRSLLEEIDSSSFFRELTTNTARNRLRDVLEVMVQDTPDTLHLAGRFWSGKTEGLDKLLSHLFNKAVSKIV